MDRRTFLQTAFVTPVAVMTPPIEERLDSLKEGTYGFCWWGHSVVNTPSIDIKTPNDFKIVEHRWCRVENKWTEVLE